MPGADAGRGRAADLDRGITVVAHHAFGAVGLADLHERAERHEFARGVARLQAQDVLGAIAELRVGLRDDLVRAAETVEIIHVERAEIDLHRLENDFAAARPAPSLSRDRRPRSSCGVLIVKLENMPASSGVFVRFADQRLRRVVERVEPEVRAVFDVEFESAGLCQDPSPAAAERSRQTLPECSPNCCCRSAAMALPESSALLRSSNGLRTTNTIPLFGRVGEAVDRKPGELRPRATRRDASSRYRVMRRITASVRSSEAADGSCANAIRYCLSCDGTKPVGTLLNDNPVNASRPT